MSIDLTQSTALIIDANPTSRSVLAAQLRDFGLASVTQSSRVSDARRLLESRDFDLVLCEMEFHAPGQQAQTGQELLDELRQANLLPWSTVFIMVTGERSYAKVAEAAESALDAYLLKPFTAQALHERVAQARKRKKVLEAIYKAVEEGQFELAARLCQARFESRGTYWLYAARMGAELYLRMGQPAAARTLLDAVVAEQALPWARLGIARAQLEQQQTTPALRTLEGLIADEPAFADAYDVLGRTQMAQGQIEQALETCRRAAEITPGAVRRQQKLGMLAFYGGDDAAATKALERSVILGQHSRMFDEQCLVLLAVLRWRQRDAKGMARCSADMARALEKAEPGSPNQRRLRRMSGVVVALDLLLRRQTAALLDALKAQAAEQREPSFDAEAACNRLMLLAEVAAGELALPEAEDWVRQLGVRFAGSKGLSELLAHAVRAHMPYGEIIKQCHLEILEAAERSLMHSVSGNPDAAVEALLAHAERSQNHKFLETAAGVLKRYADKLRAAPQHSAALAAIGLRIGQRAGPRPAVTALVGRDDEHLGGIKLRVAQPSG